MNNENNELLSRSIVLRIVEKLCKGNNELRKRFIQIYSSKYNEPPKNFIKEIAKVGVSYYNQNHGSNKSPDDEKENIRIIEISDRIANNIINSILNVSQNQNNFDFSDANEKKNSELTWELFMEKFEQSNEFLLLWEIAFNSAFLISLKYKENNFNKFRMKNWIKPHLLPAKSKLLKPEDFFIIDLNIPTSNCTNEWKLLYDNHVDGHNWTVFSNSIYDKGSTVVVIKDTNGNIFGGFASHEWVYKPDFYGDNESFIFSLRPEINIYKATQYNDHYQYFNDETKSLPNGLGMGGQFDFFGFWIDHDFINGHSKGISITYNSPSLCGSLPEYKIDTIEVWCIKEKEVDERLIKQERNKASALDRKEDMALLEMCGVKLYSKDVRDKPKIEFSDSDDEDSD